MPAVYTECRRERRVWIQQHVTAGSQRRQGSNGNLSSALENNEMCLLDREVQHVKGRSLVISCDNQHRLWMLRFAEAEDSR